MPASHTMVIGCTGLRAAIRKHQGVAAASHVQIVIVGTLEADAVAGAGTDVFVVLREVNEPADVLVDCVEEP